LDGEIIFSSSWQYQCSVFSVHTPRSFGSEFYGVNL